MWKFPNHVYTVYSIYDTKTQVLVIQIILYIYCVLNNKRIEENFGQVRFILYKHYLSIMRNNQCYEPQIVFLLDLLSTAIANYYSVKLKMFRTHNA